MLALMDKPPTDWDRVAKNIEDRVLGALLLLLAALVMALVALRGTPQQQRPHLVQAAPLTASTTSWSSVLKFRSMYTDADRRLRRQSSSPGTTPRVTPRRPLHPQDQPRRAAAAHQRRQWARCRSWVRVRTRPRPRPNPTLPGSSSTTTTPAIGMKPGVTGWAQINGWRGETDTHEKIQRRVEADLLLHRQLVGAVRPLHHRHDAAGAVVAQERLLRAAMARAAHCHR